LALSLVKGVVTESLLKGTLNKLMENEKVVTNSFNFADRFDVEVRELKEGLAFLFSTTNPDKSNSKIELRGIVRKKFRIFHVIAVKTVNLKRKFPR
jgi:tRNA U54 and U55 pseudouridine synthase Pus10